MPDLIFIQPYHDMHSVNPNGYGGYSLLIDANPDGKIRNLLMAADAYRLSSGLIKNDRSCKSLSLTSNPVHGLDVNRH